MRRVPHPQPTSLNPPVYGREKLRSASFTTQLRPISLSSNDVKVKQTAEECLLELLTSAGPEGMDIERLARKVSVSVFKKFGCKSFAENVFLELINNGPFRREGGHIFYVKKEEKPTTAALPSLPSVAQIKMEKSDKPMSPSISQEKLEKISRSADQSFEHETPSPSSKVRQPFASAEYMLNREEGQQTFETKTNNDASAETRVDIKKTETTTPSKLKNSQSSEIGDENYPDLFTTADVNSPGAKTITALKKLDPTRLNALLDVIIQVIARVAGNPYPIGQLLTEVTKSGDFTTVEVVLAIGNGPFTISELAQVNYVPELDTEVARRNEYQTLINISPISQLDESTTI